MRLFYTEQKLDLVPSHLHWRQVGNAYFTATVEREELLHRPITVNVIWVCKYFIRIDLGGKNVGLCFNLSKVINSKQLSIKALPSFQFYYKHIFNCKTVQMSL